jgi:hypothetical protein
MDHEEKEITYFGLDQDPLSSNEKPFMTFGTSDNGFNIILSLFKLIGESYISS